MQAQAARRAQPSNGLVPGCDAQAPAGTHDRAGESAGPSQPATMLVDYDSMEASGSTDAALLSWSTSMAESDSSSARQYDTESTDKVRQHPRTAIS